MPEASGRSGIAGQAATGAGGVAFPVGCLSAQGRFRLAPG